MQQGHLDDEIFIQARDRESIKALAKYTKIITNVLSENLITGWLSPTGDYYSCQMDRHVSLIEDVLGVGAFSAENAGWIKVTSFGWMNSAFKTATSSQKRFLKKIGRSHVDTHFFDDEVSYEEVFPSGNPLMAELMQKFQELAAQEEGKFEKIKPQSGQLDMYL